MTKLLKKLALTASAYLLPVVAFAQVTNVTDIASLFNQINRIINLIIPFIVGLAVFIIIWGVFTYIAGAGDEEKRAQAKSFIIWGVVGVFIMLSIWGLVSILANTLVLNKSGVGVAVPTLPTDIVGTGGAPSTTINPATGLPW